MTVESSLRIIMLLASLPLFLIYLGLTHRLFSQEWEYAIFVLGIVCLCTVRLLINVRFLFVLTGHFLILMFAYLLYNYSDDTCAAGVFIRTEPIYLFIIAVLPFWSLNDLILMWALSLKSLAVKRIVNNFTIVHGALFCAFFWILVWVNLWSIWNAHCDWR